MKEDIEKLLKYNEINNISINEDEFIIQIQKASVLNIEMPIPAIKQAIKEVKQTLITK